MLHFFLNYYLLDDLWLRTDPLRVELRLVHLGVFNGAHYDGLLSWRRNLWLWFNYRLLDNWWWFLRCSRRYNHLLLYDRLFYNGFERWLGGDDWRWLRHYLNYRFGLYHDHWWLLDDGLLDNLNDWRLLLLPGSIISSYAQRVHGNLKFVHFES